MTKKLFIIAMASAMLSTSAMAENKVHVYYEGGVGSEIQYGKVGRISPNGKYAVATDHEQYYGLLSGSFYIDLSNPGQDLKIPTGLYLSDVADNGTAVGVMRISDVDYASIYNPMGLGTDSYGNQVYTKRLPVSEFVTAQAFATCITPNGKVIGGHAFGTSTDLQHNKYYPCVWILNEATGEYDHYYFNNLDYGEVNPYRMPYIYDISDDGATLYGHFYYCGYGSSSLCVKVHDGELTIYGNEEERLVWYEYPAFPSLTGWYPESYIDGIHDEEETFSCSFFSACGDYAFGTKTEAIFDDDEEGTTEQYGFYYDRRTDEFTRVKGRYNFTCGIDPDLYFSNKMISYDRNANYIVENGKETEVVSRFNLELPSGLTLNTIYDIDRAGKFIVGGVAMFNQMLGGSVECPAVIELEQPLRPDYDPQSLIGVEDEYVHKMTTALAPVESETIEGPVSYFNLMGMPVKDATAPGMYIRKEGNTSTKVLVK